MPLAAKEDSLPADASNDNLDEALDELRHRAAGLRDELFERLADPVDDPTREPDVPGANR